MIRYLLPYPPTTNHLFGNGAKGRYRTSDYSSWRKRAKEEIQAQGKKRLKGQVVMSIYVVRPDRRRRDISNLVKAIEDVLVEMAVIEDDSLVERLSIQWADAGSFECMVMIQQHEGAIAA